MTDTKKQLEEMVKSYVGTLEKAYNLGLIYECLNGMEHYDNDIDDEHDANGDKIDFNERPTFEIYDLKFIIDGRGKYCGAELQLAVGGPGITLYTRNAKMIGSWGFSEYFEYPLDRATCDEIDDYFEDYYQCIR